MKLNQPLFESPVYGLLLVLFALSMVSQASAERYRVVQAPDGSVSAQREVIDSSPQADNALPYSEDIRDTREQQQLQRKPAEPKQALEAGEAPLASDSQEDDPLSVFEKRYLESERAEQKAALERILNAQSVQGGATDITSVDAAGFVDGDDLQQQELLQDGPTGRYFVFVDADGQRRVQYVNPELDREAMRQHAESLMPEVSEVTVIMNRASQAGATKVDSQPLAFPDAAEPLAIEILSRGSNKATFFERFTENCCADLPETQWWDISQDRSYFFEIKQGDARYRFSEGTSRFLVFTLPEFTDAYRLLVRSFVQKFGEDSLQRGVFLPQVITLNQDRVPVRVFTGPVLKYVPESWYKHAYLEGVFEITPELEEQYVLINTTADILAQVSTIEDEQLGSVELEHLEVGTFEVQALLPYR